MTGGWLRWVLLALAIGGSVSAARLDEKVRGFDHVHFYVPDEIAEQAWYRTRLNGITGEDPIRVVFSGMPYNGHGPQPVQLTWYKSEDGQQPVSGSAIDNIGFSFANLDAKVKELAAAGVKIVTPIREVPEFGRVAVIEDLFGTRIELVQDPDRLGFHHVTLRVPDPEVNLKWFVDTFGGGRIKIKGSVDAVDYGNMYLIVRKGPALVLKPGYGINHIGFTVRDIHASFRRYAAEGVKITNKPGNTLNKFGHITGYVEGPDSNRMENTQHIKCIFIELPEEPPQK